MSYGIKSDKKKEDFYKVESVSERVSRVDKTNTFRISRTSNMFRPYFVDGRKVQRIHIVNDGKIVYTTTRGWFEDNGQDVEDIFLSNYPKRKIKADLNSKENFYVKSPDNKYKSDKNNVDLYIVDKDSKLMDIKKKQLNFETETDKHYKDLYTIKVGDKTFVESGYYGTERTDFGKEVDTIYEEFGGEGKSKIERYELGKVMKKYKLIKREKEIE